MLIKIKKVLGIRFSEKEFLDKWSALMHIYAIIEPFKTLADKHYEETSFPRVMIEDFRGVARDLAEKHSLDAQKNYLFSYYLSIEDKHAGYAQLKKLDEVSSRPLKIFLASTDTRYANAFELLDLSEPSHEEAIDKIIGVFDHQLLLDHIKEMALSAGLSHLLEEMFSLSTGRDKNHDSKRYRLIAEDHVKKSFAEVFIQYNQSYETILQNYNFSNAEKREDVLRRFRRAIELGSSDEVNIICEEYLSLVQEVHDALEQSLPAV